MTQLFVIRVQQSIIMKEKWATETQNAIIPEEICHISDIFCDKVSSLVLPNVFFQKAQWETRQRRGLLGQAWIPFHTPIMDLLDKSHGYH